MNRTKFTEVRPEPEPPSAPHPDSNACPSCGSTDTAAIGIVYGSQVRSGSLSGVGMGGDGFGIGSANTSSQSLLAGQIAPPQRRSTSGPALAMILGAIGAIIGGFGSLAMIRPGAGIDAYLPAMVGACFALMVAFAFPRYQNASRFNRDELPALYGRWAKQWFCKRCGKRWTPSSRP